MTITFIKSRHETAGCLDAFEVTIPPSVHLVIPHFHRHYDETVFGVDGITTWTIDGVVTQLHPGQQLFVPRGSHHTYANLHPHSSRMICLVTPGLLGPEYFQELSYAMDEDGPMDHAAIGLIMSRYGVIPAAIVDPIIMPKYSPKVLPQGTQSSLLGN
ncbi:cupin domain-containing protein [Granulicella arctica]|uniref:cupin domain-containing protein n=1 Tax=Granulicella arctica TaxID=940613 RepID=UPI0021E0412B|nr:cupin domain-containing protein [Granulicella arctica]